MIVAIITCGPRALIRVGLSGSLRRLKKGRKPLSEGPRGGSATGDFVHVLRRDFAKPSAETFML